MFDAWGKFPSGILLGNQFEFGSFDECLEINNNENQLTFIGQYCLAQVKITLPEEQLVLTQPMIIPDLFDFLIMMPTLSK